MTLSPTSKEEGGTTNVNPPDPFFAAGKSATLCIARVDVEGRWPGTMSSPGPQVPEADEDDPEKLALGVNDDDDELDGKVDGDRVATPAIGPRDDEIATFAIRQPGVTKGTLTLSARGSGIRVFDEHLLAVRRANGY